MDKRLTKFEKDAATMKRLMALNDNDDIVVDEVVPNSLGDNPPPSNPPPRTPSPPSNSSPQYNDAKK